MRSLSLVMSMSQHWSDLEQTEYDPQEFVERLAYRARTGSGQGLSDAENLHDVFLAAIKDDPSSVTVGTQTVRSMGA